MILSRLSLVLAFCICVTPFLHSAEPAPAGQVTQIKITTDKSARLHHAQVDRR